MTKINPALVTQSMSMDAIKNSKHGELALKVLHIMSYLKSQVPAIIFLGLGDHDKLKNSIDLLERFAMIRSHHHGNILMLDVHEVVQENTRLLLKEQETEALAGASALLDIAKDRYGNLINLNWTTLGISVMNSALKN